MNAIPAVDIRRGVVADAEILAALAARVFHVTFAEDNNPDDMALYMRDAFSTAQFAAELASPAARFFIARRQAIMVGYAKLAEGPPPECVRGESPIELSRLYVEHALHGAGVGRKLLEACFEDARAEHRRTIWLGVWDRNHRARAFYRKMGFRDVGEHPFILGNDHQTDLVMERAL